MLMYDLNKSSDILCKGNELYCQCITLDVLYVSVFKCITMILLPVGFTIHGLLC